MKKILITGANGSTGKILFKRLSKNYNTFGLVKKETSNRKFFTFKNIFKKKNKLPYNNTFGWNKSWSILKYFRKKNVK